jgi:hypothetical protein
MLRTAGLNRECHFQIESKAVLILIILPVKTLPPSPPLPSPPSLPPSLPIPPSLSGVLMVNTQCLQVRLETLFNILKEAIEVSHPHWFDYRSSKHAPLQVATEKLEAAVVQDGMSSNPMVACARDMVQSMNAVLELLQ